MEALFFPIPTQHQCPAMNISSAKGNFFWHASNKIMVVSKDAC